MKNLPVLTLHQTAIAVAACARAGRVPLVIGPPGVAKSTLINAIGPMIGTALGYTTEGSYKTTVCVLSNRDAVDIGGYPVVLSDNTVSQKLFGTLRHAAEHATLLGLDEFLTCSQAVQGPALRLVLERFAGEQPLHKDTRIVCVANPPDHAPGGIQMTAALVNRVIILQCRPLMTEIGAYFCGRPEANLTLDLRLPDDEEWRERRARLMDTAGILFEQRADLICLDPPPAAISDGEPFASPRAWEACCEVLAALPAAHVRTVSDVTRALVLGAIGPGSGISYLGILRAREHLPTVTEVLADPENARLPDPRVLVEDPDNPKQKKPIGRDVTFAAIPLVIEVGRVDTYAAFCYVDRFNDEIKAAVAKHLCLRVKAPANTPWRTKGNQILLRVSAQMTAAPAAPVAVASNGKRKAS